MKISAAVTAFALTLVAAVAAGPSDAQAKKITIAGKVPGGKGMTVIAAARDGRAKTRRLRSAKFKLRVPGKAGTGLQLVNRNGKFFGPIILGKARKGRAYRALSGKANARLGRLKKGRGHYKVRKRIARRALWRRQLVKLDRTGAPVGAGRLGFRPRARRSAAVSQEPGDRCEPGADADVDGITNAYDLDDDGDGILDIVDWENANYTLWCPTNTFSNLMVDLQVSQNLNGAAVTQEDVDRLVSTNLLPVLGLNHGAWDGQEIRSVNVDCFQLPWCRPGGGTATFATDPNYEPGPEPLFSDHDPDGDGLPNLMRRGNIWDAGLRARATTDQITPADTLNYKVETAAGTGEFSSTFGPYFVTTPGIAQLRTARGQVQNIAYPPKPGDPGASGGHAYSGNPIRLDDTTLTVIAWRPQRLAIDGAEGGDWRDIGRLRYSVGASSTNQSWTCTEDSVSQLSPGLRMVGEDEHVTFEDQAEDAPPDAANIISFTVDLAACAGNRNRIAGREGWVGLRADFATGGNSAQSIFVVYPD